MTQRFAKARVERLRLLSGLLATVALAASLGACAAIRKEEIHQKENRLIAAGFRMIVADTPERARQLSTMPANKLVARPLNDGSGKVFYVYADPKQCQCLYIGGPAQYAKLQQIKIQQEEASANIDAAMAEESAAMDMEDDDWGPMVEW